MKRGQVTTYVILGLVILFVIGIIFFLRGNVIQSILEQDTQKIKDVPPQVQVINDFVQDCVESTSEDALYVIGQHGGYFITPQPSTVNKVYYYFINNRVNIPEKGIIENEISKYINQELSFCTNFSNFEGFQISQGNIRSKISINENDVLISLKYPLNIKREDIDYSLEDFNINLDIRLGLIYDVSKEIVNKQVEDPEYTCLTCILNLSLENEIFIDRVDYPGNTVVYMITDPNSILKGHYYSLETEPQHYKFLFANKFGVVS